MTGCPITGNAAGGEGGGICARDAQLTLMGSTISGNTARMRLSVRRSGGGIFFDGGGTLTVTNSVISGNSAVCRRRHVQ